MADAPPLKTSQPVARSRKVITIRMTPADHARIKLAAHLAFMSMEEFCRRRILGDAELTTPSQSETGR